MNTETEVKEAPKIDEAKKLAEEKHHARVHELKSLVGKTYCRKVPNPKVPKQYFVVTGYGGTPTHPDGRKYYTLEVESREPNDLKWTPAAIHFLEHFEPFETEQKTTNTETI